MATSTTSTATKNSGSANQVQESQLSLALQSKKQYTVTIKLHDRPKFVIAVEKSTIIEEFKYAIEEITNIPWTQLELVKEDKPRERLK